MPRKRTLIPTPLAWTTMQPTPVPAPVLPVIAERGGTQIRTPLPIAIIDTREQNPLSFRRFRKWFSRIEYRALPLGDYSVAGMEDTCIVERKDLADLIQSFTTNRSVFVKRLQRMSAAPHSLLVVTAPMTEIKSEYPYRAASPNRIMQSLIAVLAGLRLPFLCTDTHELGEEIVASFLYQTFLYDWLDRNGHGRQLADGDL
ncbi:MAG TPA: ERCC4 domain-containing protein [Candidatus Sulfotelmatobacter sp.]|nr:ERCC4 domain-containing protein [Candidatus Sulfotelmatobacter sp.]